MNEKQLQQFIDENIDKIDPTDAYYIQYMQAKKIREAILDDINNGSPTAATDKVIFTIDDKVLDVGCFNAEAVSAFDEALFNIMQNAIENIHIG